MQDDSGIPAQPDGSSRPHSLGRRLGMTDRRRALALGSAALAIAGLVIAGTTMDADPGTPTMASAIPDPAGRDRAAERADRSGRNAGDEPQGPDAAQLSTSPPAPPSAPPSTPAKPAAAAPKAPPAWVLPMHKAEITSCYGLRWGTLHQGIDFATPPSTPVRAVGAGVVVGAGWLYGGYGVSVMIDHGNGYRTHYAHLKFAKVVPGQRVVANQMIGGEGSTGDSTGPHLHFEVHRGVWGQVEPASWLRARGVQVPGC